MHIIQQRKSSICPAIILIALLEFSFVEESLSNQNACGDKNRGTIAYFTLRNEAVNWIEAWRQCNNQSATLPVICNHHEQNAFTKYLRDNARYSSAWTSARKIAFDGWKWIDGQTFTWTRDVITEDPPHELYTRALLNKAGIYTAAEPRHKHHYLCHYNSGSACMHGNAIHVKNGCIRPSNDTRSWFDARNQCVDIDDDLAIVDDDDLVNLKNTRKLNADRGYWIGLGNTTWRWMWHKAEPADDSDDEVKYTNWANDQPDSRECISINASNGRWYSEHCTERKKVICQASLGSDETSMKSSALTTSRPTISNKSPNGPTKSMGTTSIFSGVFAGIVIIIICIIVIIFVVRYKRKPHKDVNQTKVMNNSEQNVLHLSPNKPATSPAKAPANAPVNPLLAGTDDAQGVYAEITLAPLNQSEDETKLQQPGIVYAALEFQKEPTYLEPIQKSAQASDQTKVGPARDIYAIPDAKGRTGNEANSHPLLVTSQGDIYALPLKNSKSPTANTPVGDQSS